jgi:hypothetical protein
LKPGRQCGICATPDLALKCDGLLASGYSLIEIASELNVSKFVVSRHKRHSALKLSDAEAKSLPEDRLETLYDRCDQLFSSLASAGDAKGAADILKTQARLAEAAVQRAEAKQEAATETAATDSAPTPAQFDNVKKKVDAFYKKQIEQGLMVWCPCGRPIAPSKLKAFVENYHADSAVN